MVLQRGKVGNGGIGELVKGFDRVFNIKGGRCWWAVGVDGPKGVSGVGLGWCFGLYLGR